MCYDDSAATSEKQRKVAAKSAKNALKTPIFHPFFTFHKQGRDGLIFLRFLCCRSVVLQSFCWSCLIRYDGLHLDVCTKIQFKIHRETA